MMKSFFRTAFVREILARLLSLYMYLVRLTTVWEIRGAENLFNNLEPEKGIVACLWHSRIILIPSVFDLKILNVSMLFSLSKDGNITTRVGEIMGYDIIRGSSAKKRDDKTEDKGGMAAFRSMLSAIKKGNIVALTPDGPSGPRLKMSNGAIRTAKTAKALFIPIAASVRKSRLATSWDKLLLPPLFSKGVIIYGAPIEVKAQNDLEFEAMRLKCENALLEITNLADEECDVQIVAPIDESNNNA